LREYTDKYFASFKEDLKKLNIPTDKPEIEFIRVSEKIPEIKDFIKKYKIIGGINKSKPKRNGLITLFFIKVHRVNHPCYSETKGNRAILLRLIITQYT